jgi:tetratricopeptide (TPR) repeat protein
MALDRDAVLEAAGRLVERRRYEQALGQYVLLVENDPRDARTLLKVGDLQCRLGSHAQAIDAYARAGDVYTSQGHALKAIATYTKVRELIALHAPQLEDPYAHLTFTIVDLYVQLGLHSDALAVLDAAARRLEQHGKEREAIEVLRRTTEIDPQSCLPRLHLAEALSRADDPAGAAREMGIAATQLVASGRTDAALTVIDRLLHHRADPVFARMAAEIHLAKDTHQDAILALTKLQICVRADPRDVGSLRLLARAFAALGHEERVAEVKREIAAIAQASELPAMTPSPEPASSLALKDTAERAAVQVIEVSAQSWNDLAARLQAQEGGGVEEERVIAFVCSDDERSTIRTIYGVVKVLFA